MSAVILWYSLAALAQDPSGLAGTIDRLIPEILGYQQSSEAPISEDGEFLRRLMLDLVGHPPSLDEALAFSADGAPGKRKTRIDTLLASPEFSDFWGRR